MFGLLVTDSCRLPSGFATNGTSTRRWLPSLEWVTAIGRTSDTLVIGAACVVVIA